jgi:hypothetical protein
MGGLNLAQRPPSHPVMEGAGSSAPGHMLHVRLRKITSIETVS